LKRTRNKVTLGLFGVSFDVASFLWQLRHQHDLYPGNEIAALYPLISRALLSFKNTEAGTPLELNFN
jgi:hypothetical protein